MCNRRVPSFPHTYTLAATYSPLTHRHAKAAGGGADLGVAMDKNSRHGLLVALLVGALLLVLGLLALFSYYPIFGMTLTTTAYAIWCYLFSENHLVHRAQVSSNIPACACGCCCCCCCGFSFVPVLLENLTACSHQVQLPHLPRKHSACSACRCCACSWQAPALLAGSRITVQVGTEDECIELHAHSAASVCSTMHCAGSLH